MAIRTNLIFYQSLTPMQKLLFIDRDGTIIKEPADEQIDSLEKLEFVPGAIGGLHLVMNTDYLPLLVSNQDGLGTPSFPEDTFWPAHRKMLQTLAGEGVTFAHEYIDPAVLAALNAVEPADNAPHILGLYVVQQIAAAQR